MRIPHRVIYACALAVAVRASAQTPTDVQPPNVPTTPNIPAPPTGPGPSTGGPFGIRLEVVDARPSDFAQVQRAPNGDPVQLGASFYDTANGQTIQNACVPEYDLSNQFAPDGSPRGEFDHNAGAILSDNDTKCHGVCRIKFRSPGAFTVHAHCLDHPEISSAGNQGDFNFESSTAPWAGGHPLQPTVPSLLHPQPAPGPTTAAAAKSGGGLSISTQILIGVALALATYEVISLASGDSGSSGTPNNAFCFDVAASCSDAGRYCNMSSEADCESYESDVTKLCSCTCTITKSCFGCVAGVNGCAPSGGRVAQPVPPRALHAPQAPRSIARSAPAPIPTATASSGFPWLRAAEIALVVGATSFTVYELTRSKHPMRVAPWVGPEGGGLTLMGAF